MFFELAQAITSSATHINYFAAQAQGVKVKSELTTLGVEKVDYLEDSSVSTQAVVFSAVHWHTALKTAESRASADTFLDRFLYVKMGAGTYHMTVSKDARPGAFTATGAHVEVQGGHITDIRPLAAYSKVMKESVSRIAWTCCFVLACAFLCFFN